MFLTRVSLSLHLLSLCLVDDQSWLAVSEIDCDNGEEALFLDSGGLRDRILHDLNVIEESQT